MPGHDPGSMITEKLKENEAKVNVAFIITYSVIDFAKEKQKQ